MNASRQAPPSEPEDSGGASDARRAPQGDPGADAASDPIGAIEAALVMMRRDQGRRRLQRRAEHEAARSDGEQGEQGGPGGPGWEPGRWRGPHPHHHGGPPHHDHDHDEGAGHGFGRSHGPQALAHAARFRLLDALGASDRPPSVSELADAIGVDQPRASRLVQAAVDAGHVRREADPSDARRSALVLTSAGRELLSSARSNRRGAVEAALAGFSEEETVEFARLLGRFVAGWPRG